MSSEKNALTPEQEADREVEAFVVIGEEKDVEKDAEKEEAPEADAEAGKEDAGAEKGDKADGDKAEDIPDWVKERISRASKKEEHAEARIKEADRRANEALSLAESLQARLDEIEGAGGDEAPDPDDFDTVAAYERAKKAWQNKSKRKPEEKKAPKKEEDAAPAMPSGMSEGEFNGIVTEIRKSMTPETIKGIESLPTLTADMVVAIHDIADGDPKVMESVGKFYAANATLLSEIAQLPERRRLATIERAYREQEGGNVLDERRKSVKQPEVIDRSKGRTPQAYDDDDFAAYERRRNAEEFGI